VNSMTCILWLNYEFVLTASSRRLLEYQRCSQHN
jgi:hypothetical protein